jgi:hypothetical protein
MAESNAGAEVGRAFSTDTQRRKDEIAELLAQRQTPLNEINALMSGSQVNNPFAIPGAMQNANVAPPPIFGAAQAQGQSDINAANLSAQQGASTQQGLIGAASVAAMFF